VHSIEGNAMKRREFISLAAGAAIAAPLPTWAQRMMPVVGILSPFNDAESTLLADVRAGLRHYGYVEGQNVRIEYRSTEGRVELLPGLVSDILQRNADVIVTASAPAIRAASQATTKTPIIFARMGDAVDQGIVASLAQPGGNITGISWFAPELSGKLLGILNEAVPGMSRVAIFREAAAGVASATAVDTAAHRLGLKSQIFQARVSEELEAAFSAMADANVDSLVVLEGVMIFNNARTIAQLAEKHRLPAIFFDPVFVDAGGLLSYGPNFSEMHRRAAYFVDRILKGAKPSDLPVEQPTKFDLVVNVATARKWGFALPASLLVRADRVVE
jgi:putative ABC transport system substrate-binding protein